MNLQDFQTAISPIVSRWPRGYSGDQLQLIQEEVKMLSHPDFVRLVRHLLGSSRVAPMVPDFRKAITDLGLKAQRRPEVVETTYSSAPTEPENFLYHLMENFWADNKYIFIRGDKPSFVIKNDYPSHPLVIKDCNVRDQKIKECKLHLVKGTHAKFEQDKINDMRRVNFSDFKVGGET